MLRQYYEAKAAHPDVIMAIRVGDFYEFYGEDAEKAHRLLEITLTGREDGGNGRIPMAGVPHHAVEKYLARLVAMGQRVALMDQLEDPKQAKGLVKRGVTRVLSAGTVLEESMLQAGSDNYVTALVSGKSDYGLASLDPSTGSFLVTQLTGDGLRDLALNDIARIMPAELLFSAVDADFGSVISEGLKIPAVECRIFDAVRAEETVQRQLGVASLAGFGLEGKTTAILAAAMVLEYARTNGVGLSHVKGLQYYVVDEAMLLDAATRRSLEITHNASDGSRRHTLLEAMDFTQTAFGSRLLKRWLDQPSRTISVIESRHEAVQRLIEHALTRSDLRACLKRFGDIERLVSRSSAGLAGPRDLVALRSSLQELPKLDEAFHKVALGRLGDLRSQIGKHQDLAWTLRQALNDEVPHVLRDGGVIRTGHDEELDALRALSQDGKSFIAKLEASEREATGIDKIKVGFNSVFGYYLEIPKSMADRVPGHYIRKQTTASTERYITDALKTQESRVIGAQDRSLALEADLFSRLRAAVAAQAQELLQTASALAELDVLCCFAEAAVIHHYVRPVLTEDDVMIIRQARHAVVERYVNQFVPNDVDLGQVRLKILTGPNMSGKSTYLRQAALIAILCQCGSFVPATDCRMGLCDRVFARIGARDELAVGQSTFMVEMVESANILNNATAKSLVILDEVGRGTSTYDGLAIAWAMVEYLAAVGCKCLFATHYHQLNAVEEENSKVANYRVEVEEHGDQIVWTHRVLRGGTDRSYGIHVAKMAGVPPVVLRRAEEVLTSLEAEDLAVPTSQGAKPMQLTLFDTAPSPIIQELEKMDLNRLTPMEAMMKLDEWKKRL